MHIPPNVTGTRCRYIHQRLRLLNGLRCFRRILKYDIRCRFWRLLPISQSIINSESQLCAATRMYHTQPELKIRNAASKKKVNWNLFQGFLRIQVFFVELNTPGRH
jgi:hypothetical protein